jgi:hypothetical protein
MMNRNAKRNSTATQSVRKSDVGLKLRKEGDLLELWLDALMECDQSKHHRQLFRIWSDPRTDEALTRFESLMRAHHSTGGTRHARNDEACAAFRARLLTLMSNAEDSLPATRSAITERREKAARHLLVAARLLDAERNDDPRPSEPSPWTLKSLINLYRATDGRSWSGFMGISGQQRYDLTEADRAVGLAIELPKLITAVAIRLRTDEKVAPLLDRVLEPQDPAIPPYRTGKTARFRAFVRGAYELMTEATGRANTPLIQALAEISIEKAAHGDAAGVIRRFEEKKSPKPPLP